MTTQSMGTVVHSPPDWWNLDLYKFMSKMQLEGWVWEFMRRSRLLLFLDGKPVDAMNPEPDLSDMDPANWNYYKPWDNSWWETRFPYRIPDAAWCNQYGPDHKWYMETKPHGAPQYWIYQRSGKHHMSFTIDLKRKTNIIVRDLRKHIQKVREKENIRAIRVSKRKDDWAGNQILAVWDLRQYRVSWHSIYQLLGRSDVDNLRHQAIGKVRRFYNSACHYIGEVVTENDKRKLRQGRWVDLARSIEH